MDVENNELGVKDLLGDRTDALKRLIESAKYSADESVDEELSTLTEGFLEKLDGLAENITAKISALQREKERVLLLQGTIAKIVPKL